MAEATRRSMGAIRRILKTQGTPCRRNWPANPW